ncbi:hypothetical protein Tco_1231064, partial [Tanacetum coccineum]
KDGHGAEASSRNATDGDANGASIKGMVLPYTPIAMSFDNMNYYVDMPSVGALGLECLTASMGVREREKPHLMDVLAGRRLAVIVKDDIRISGFPKIFVQEVIELVELDNIKDAIVGLPGVMGRIHIFLHRMSRMWEDDDDDDKRHDMGI